MLRTNCDRCGATADAPTGRHFVEVPTTGAPARIVDRFDLCEKCSKALAVWLNELKPAK